MQRLRRCHYKKSSNDFAVIGLEADAFSQFKTFLDFPPRSFTFADFRRDGFS
jgi:hypothetical protein